MRYIRDYMRLYEMWSVFLFGSSRHYIKNSAQWEYYHFTFQQSAQNWRPEMYKDFLPSLVIKWRIHFTTTALIIRIANIQRHLAARRALWQENFSPLHSIVKSLWAFSLFCNCYLVAILCSVVNNKFCDIKNVMLFILPNCEMTHLEKMERSWRSSLLDSHSEAIT